MECNACACPYKEEDTRCNFISLEIVSGLTGFLETLSIVSTCSLAPFIPLARFFSPYSAFFAFFHVI